MAERIFRVLSNPVESIKRLSEATQNQTRRVNIKNCVTPGAVIAKVTLPMFTVHRGLPVVKNRVGREIKAINKGINRVRVKSCFRGMWEARAKITGIVQMASKYESLLRNRADMIMEAMATNFAMGFMDCMKPFLPLKSSM